MTTLTTIATAAGTGGLQAWIKDNVIPLLLLLIAVMLFVLAQRGDNAKAMKVVAGVVIALAALGLASSGEAGNLGAWADPMRFTIESDDQNDDFGGHHDTT
jgi:hypothetical protein